LYEIGLYAFYGTALKRIAVPSTVTIIHSNAFSRCKQLKEVEFCEGLQEIRDEAFLSVGPLKRLTFPNTVRNIGTLAFCHVYQLQYLRLPEAIESIGMYAFGHNRCTTCRIPPSLTSIAGYFIGRCQSMFSIELPEGITSVERHALQECHSLRNIAFPRNAEVRHNAFDRCTDLQQLHGTEEELINALQHRFDNLLIHKVVYYQSYNNVTSDQLNDATNMGSGHKRSLLSTKLNPTGKHQDCLGMTPLHIMACSTVQSIDLYKVLIEQYPENLITEDRWGSIPLLYAVWGQAPDEIVHYLVESYKSIHPKYEFNWTKLVEQLCLGNASTSSIQMLLDVQQDFPDQTIDWQTIIQKAAMKETPSVQADVFGFLAKNSYSKRIDAIGIKQWRDDATVKIEERMMIENGPIEMPKSYLLSSDLPQRQHWLFSFIFKLSRYEARYQELKEATTVLELVLWKNKISEARKSTNQDGGSRKKMKFEESDFREQCRSRNGVDIVIENVLPYLY